MSGFLPAPVFLENRFLPVTMFARVKSPGGPDAAMHFSVRA
jgi:hypothetical protein